MPRWYFTKEELAKIPSIKDGLDPKEELKLRQQAAGFIQDMGIPLEYYPRLLIVTAVRFQATA